MKIKRFLILIIFFVFLNASYLNTINTNIKLTSINYRDINNIIKQFEATQDKSIYTQKAEVQVCLNSYNKIVALTFDDGPNPLTTPKLLDGLAQRNIKATFFLLGSCIEENKDIIKRMYNEGHNIGNHSYSHKNLLALDIQSAKMEYSQTNEILNSIIGTSSIAFRPPYGNYNETIQSFINTPLVLWDIDPLDWKDKDSDRIANHIIQKAKDGDIILLHDIYQTSVDAAFKVIDTLEQRGFHFVTINELLTRNGVEPHAGEVFRFMNKIKDNDD